MIYVPSLGDGSWQDSNQVPLGYQPDNVRLSNPRHRHIFIALSLSRLRRTVDFSFIYVKIFKRQSLMLEKKNVGCFFCRASFFGARFAVLSYPVTLCLCYETPTEGNFLFLLAAPSSHVSVSVQFGEYESLIFYLGLILP